LGAGSIFGLITGTICFLGAAFLGAMSFCMFVEAAHLFVSQ
jgi:hypothetical protein